MYIVRIVLSLCVCYALDRFRCMWIIVNESLINTKQPQAMTRSVWFKQSVCWAWGNKHVNLIFAGANQICFAFGSKRLQQKDNWFEAESSTTINSQQVYEWHRFLDVDLNIHHTQSDYHYSLCCSMLSIDTQSRLCDFFRAISCDCRYFYSVEIQRTQEIFISCGIDVDFKRLQRAKHSTNSHFVHTQIFSICFNIEFVPLEMLSDQHSFHFNSIWHFNFI